MDSPMKAIAVVQIVSAVAAALLALRLVRQVRHAGLRDFPAASVVGLALMTFVLGGTLAWLGADWAASTNRKQIIDRFHATYYDDPSTWKTAHWLDIPTQQNPNDVWLHQELITRVKPDFIIEAGTLYGGSAALWAMILEQVNPDGRVITIDVTDGTAKARARIPIWSRKVDFLLGSSTDAKILADVEQRVRGKKVLVILDSLHTRDHVLAELEAYAHLVAVGSYMIVQDTNVNGNPVSPDFGPGPMEAVEAFLASNDHFVSDPVGDKLLFTMHPKGYLKRVR